MEKNMTLPRKILLSVEKPARYVGGEVNMVEKNRDEVALNFCLCFPDTYEIGMSHAGFQILYYMLNDRQDTYCERAFSPWTDMRDIIKKANKRVWSLETYTSLDKFDILGFTLQYEMSYTNVLDMLNLSGLPLRASERGDDMPIVCAGGPCAYNPEPLAEAIDFFYIGEAEASLNAVLDIYTSMKRENFSKHEFLRRIAGIEGIYVPCLYDVSYNEDNTIKSITPNDPAAPAVVQKAFCKSGADIYAPEKALVPNIEVVHDRVQAEVMRGCMRGCRFCQAGFVYRPMRERDKDSVFAQCEQLIDCTGYDELSLISLSTSDYSAFPELADELIDTYKDSKVNISLPSLRIDAANLSIMARIQRTRKSSQTFAPEAGTQRLRDAINKNLTEEEILNGCKLAFEMGWDRLKLYFMIGLPTETEEDLLGVAKLAHSIVEKFYELPKERRPRMVQINASASCFVPKPHTPFQWERQNTTEEFNAKGMMIKKAITKRQVKFQFHNERVSVIEGIIARGDRRLFAILERVWQQGACFESWTEMFKHELWENAFAELGIDPTFYTRERSFDEILPWEHISCGVSKGFLIKEAKKSRENKTTPDCRENCSACGLNCKNGEVGCYA